MTTSALPSSEWLTSREAMALLKISKSTLHKLRNTGQLPTYYLRYTTRYRREDVLKCLTVQEMQRGEHA